jgi:hypothetical protein
MTRTRFLESSVLRFSQAQPANEEELYPIPFYYFINLVIRIDNIGIYLFG